MTFIQFQSRKSAFGKRVHSCNISQEWEELVTNSMAAKKLKVNNSPSCRGKNFRPNLSLYVKVMCFSKSLKYAYSATYKNLSLMFSKCVDYPEV